MNSPPPSPSVPKRFKPVCYAGIQTACGGASVDNLTVIVNNQEIDAAGLSAALPDAVRLDFRPDLPIADGQANLLICAISDDDGLRHVSELLRPVAVGGRLAIFGPSATIAKAAEMLPEAVVDDDGDLALPALATGDRLVLRRTGVQHTGSAGCIICGRENASGLRWQYWQSGERAWASGEIPAHLQGFHGIVHGGIIAAMLDDALWYAINAATGQITLTAELTTRYRRPAPIGSRLTAAARYTGNQRRILTAEARLWGPNGEVLATATGRFLPGDNDLADRIG